MRSASARRAQPPGEEAEDEIMLLRAGGAAGADVGRASGSGARGAQAARDVGGGMGAHGTSGADGGFIVGTCKEMGCLSPTFGLILLYYALSITLSIFNKEMVGQKFQDFPAPLLMVSVQFLFQIALCALAAKLRPDLNLSSRALAWDVWAQTTGSLGLLTGLDIGVSNVALRTISLSSYTIIKAASPLGIALASFAMGVEKLRCETLLVVGAICAGVALVMVGVKENSEENDFPVTGMVLAVVAMALSGVRWTLTQVMLHKEELGLSHPIALLNALLPSMTATVFVLSLGTESYAALETNLLFDLLFAAALLLSAFIALAMTSTEFALVATTSAISLGIVGVCKEVLLIVAAVILLGDPFGLLNMVGLSLVVSGVFLYKNEMMLRAQGQPRASRSINGREPAREGHPPDPKDGGATRLPLHITIDEPATQLRGIVNPSEVFSLSEALDAELDAAGAS